MTSKLRVGILGAGWAATSHAIAFSRLPNVVVNAFWNRTRARVEKLAGELNQSDFQIYDHWQELIEKADIDVVSVATAELLRREPVEMALERGLHVLVEKPFSIELADAQAMVQAANKADAISAICLNWRYAPGAQVSWQGIREGWIGQIFDVQMVWRFGARPRAMYETWPWFTEKTDVLGGGGSHEFDRARFLTGSEFIRIASRVRPFSLPQEPEYTVHGTYSLIADLSNGVEGDFRLTLTTGQSEWYLVLNGAKGSLTVTHETVIRQREAEEKSQSLEIPASQRIPDGIDMIQHTWNRLIADFVTAVRNNDKRHVSVPHLPTLVDGLRTPSVSQ